MKTTEYLAVMRDVQKIVQGGDWYEVADLDGTRHMIFAMSYAAAKELALNNAARRGSIPSRITTVFAD